MALRSTKSRPSWGHWWVCSVRQRSTGGGNMGRREGAQGLKMEMAKLKMQNAFVLSNFVRCVLDMLVGVAG